MSTEEKQKNVRTKPALSCTQAIEIIDRVFGRTVLKILPLPSYDDQNFYIIVSDSNQFRDCVTEYVFKIARSSDSENADLIEAQTRVMMFLKERGFPCAMPVLTRDGKIMSLETVDCGLGNNEYLVRLLTYLPGILVAKISAGPEVWYEIGRMAAQIDKAIQEEFQHPTIKSLHRGDFIWNLSNTHFLEKYTCLLGQDGNRQIVEEVIQQFKEKILPNLSKFRPCVNHGDLNEQNILVESFKASNEAAGKELVQEYQISGVLDFGDMSYGYYVFELAITIMYAMTVCQEPINIGGHILAGFESVVPLTPEERDAVFLLVSCRFCQSLVIAEHTVLLYPENREYLMITAHPGRKQLCNLWKMGKEAIEKIWFGIAASYKGINPN
ncbi:hydroxylysine kinase [Latimeria chalumnae]|uniref:hydroxylysine kinase n=1 Tax=Latimeria chalumnae TaxID=7897 RepID=UPI00313E1443